MQSSNLESVAATYQECVAKAQSIAETVGTTDPVAIISMADSMFRALLAQASSPAGRGGFRL